ncbi:hypothetical protein MLD38_016115 [Melastoma candidum]|uniref:Uncharacterized protein n=1 Tax=Melastoma candidum TaxID=119954 RepID=A0ACB9RRV1_9MYRT|nr:hypothetical protein MLD38_016115 [Melastoma candidum]
MESLPVEVIGNILSRFKAARDVVIASRRKWREACRYHLRALSFDFSNWFDLATRFSSPRPSSRPMASTAGGFVAGTYCDHEVEPSYQKFPCLRLLSLSHVSLSALDWSLLLLICPRIESLALINADIAMSDTQVTMESISTSLKDHVEVLSLDKLVVEADNLQKLRLRNRFMVWVAGLLERCPNLKKLVIYVSASRANLEEEYEMIANMHTAVIPLMRKHNQIFLTLFYL